VRLLDSRWNHFEASLYLMQRKLADLEVVLVGNEAVYESGEDDSTV
jgi:hypothetical protein